MFSGTMGWKGFWELLSRNVFVNFWQGMFLVTFVGTCFCELSASNCFEKLRAVIVSGTIGMKCYWDLLASNVFRNHGAKCFCKLKA